MEKSISNRQDPKKLLITINNRHFISKDKFVNKFIIKTLSGKLSPLHCFNKIKEHYLGIPHTSSEINLYLSEFFPEFSLLTHLPGCSSTKFSDKKINFLNQENSVVSLQEIEPSGDSDHTSFATFYEAVEKFQSSKEISDKRYPDFFKELEVILPQAKFDNNQKLSVLFSFQTVLEKAYLDFPGLFDKNDVTGTILLVFAVKFQCHKLIKLFSELGLFDINFQSKEAKNSILHIAAGTECLKCFETTLYIWKKYGKSIDEPKNKVGNTPFLHACECGNFEIIQSCVKAGANTMVSNNNERCWLMILLSNEETIPCFRKIIETGLLDPLSSPIGESGSGLFGFLNACSDAAYLDEFLEANFSSEQNKVIRWMASAHFLSHILNTSSSEFGSYVCSILEFYLDKYANEKQKPVALELAQILKTQKWENINSSFKKNHKNLAELRLFFSDYPKHVRGCISIITPHKQLLIDCNGGFSPLVIKNIKEMNLSTGAFHWEKKIIGTTPSGISVYKIKDETSNSFKQKIQKALQDDTPIEEKVHMLFKGKLSSEKQKVGNCAYFNTKLTLKTLWGILSLASKGISFKNTDDYYETLAKEIQFSENYNGFEAWLVDAIFSVMIDFMTEIDLIALKKTYPIIYNDKINTIAKTLLVMLTRAKTKERVKKIITIIPKNILHILMSTRVDNEETLSFILSVKMKNEFISELNKHLPEKQKLLYFSKNFSFFKKNKL
ncbi:MAG: hypothetical protein COZ46_04790 [Verrucomicrobia bacterium CG_4_10_14_3_um_filter_43_23]|nr:MAG: hypothetical protein AUJ82_08335 [Verrucomicrobia bacterium CG1_02_43_26]PIP59921.1 MAG: hypothetical protein COX01_00825 [Verrucomicrobia bacterium CG22_combo_CG10-13_8_21_14_all_43_17]PIX58261.1 MAG: hypothetical protein COZ46_04790 [Verrucomicrobia bacterium CG_4_10_14_3_um_filter_43_23]PIY62447.1 MAG: hypothetical protein COY94_02100 [Verrucomicrobia bacterium CG_4_10_14_0_8_um_filter_43_34]PJA44453.1 MAG: hypothetical protein CO175_02725 [Verrucomicrobia bacterium CG_4_9_14_3_um_fi